MYYEFTIGTRNKKLAIRLEAVQLYTKVIERRGLNQFPVDEFIRFAGQKKYNRNTVLNFINGRSANKELLRKLKNYYKSLEK